jgi:GNAT superfamily N-acetyltransferase
MPATAVTRTYLEQRDAAQLRAPGHTPEGARIEPIRDCPPSFYRWLYATVGGPWNWYERREWDDARIRAHLQDPAILLRLLIADGAPAGYYELARHAGGDIEIGYIGLVPERIGRNLGGFLVAEAAREAWALGASRVWLHTCTLDGPAALPNYLRRGFVAYRTEDYVVDIPTSMTQRSSASSTP